MSELAQKQEVPLDVSPGQVLKRLRLENERSLEDVHRETMISLERLAQIEDDNYEGFEAEVFVLGYIRCYAKAVGANADGLVQCYQARFGKTSVRKVRSDPSDDAQHVNVKPWPSFFSKFPFFAVVAILVVVWVLGAILFNGDESERPDSPAVVPVEGPAEALQEHAQVETASAVSESEAPLVTPAPENNIVAMPPEVEGGDTLLPTIEKPTSKATATALPKQDLPVETSPSSLDSTIEMRFSDECWVEVVDASGKTLFADLQNSGDNLRLFGPAPFNIMLGNARAVELRVDGKVFPIVLKGTTKTLRFKVEP